VALGGAVAKQFCLSVDWIKIRILIRNSG